MNSIPVLHKQPVSVSYEMFIDNRGILENREVREKSGADQGYGSEDTLIQTGSQYDTNRIRADIKKDLIFKLFLGNEAYKEEVVLPFHRAFWGNRIEIKNLELKTAPLNGSTVDGRTISPDVVWQNPETGDIFLTEMQRQRQQFYSERISLYDGKLRASLAQKSGKWDYKQVSVFVLGIADFNLSREGPQDYLHEYASVNLNDHSDLLTGKDIKILADLKKARKVDPDISSERYKWIYLLNNFHTLKEVPSFLKGGYFDEVIKIAQKLNRTKMEEFEDFLAELHREDREKRAEARALRRGMKKGKELGKKLGKKLGEEAGRLETIKAFLENRPKEIGASAPEIAALFGVDEKLVEPLLLS